MTRATTVLIAATMFAIASGSSSVRWVIEHTRGWVRWALLVALGVAALVAAARGPRLTLRAPATIAAVFAALCVLSTAWSVEPRLTFERAGTLVVVFVAGAALAASNQRRAVLDGILLGAVAIAVASLLTLAFSHDNAVQPATLAYGARFQGYSQNPNTLGMVLALAFPIALWVAFTHRGAVRVAAACAAALLFGELAATGSRGSLAAALVGALVVVGALAPRLRLAFAGAAVVVFAAGAVAARISEPATSAPSAVPPRLQNDAELRHPLETEIGAPAPGAPVHRRSLLSSSGRFEAWRGAIRQGNERPIAGYGFGTEGDVFVDRYYGLDSNLTENSYVGLYLQLGLTGVVVLALLLVAAVRRGIARRDAVVLAVVAAGIVLAVGQSYLFSAGATGMLPFWLCVFLTSVAVPRTA
jgi:O-antigen ligase